MTSPSKNNPVISAIMGRLNHCAIDNDDVKVPTSWFPVEYHSESFPYPDTTLIKINWWWWNVSSPGIIPFRTWWRSYVCWTPYSLNFTGGCPSFKTLYSLYCVVLSRRRRNFWSQKLHTHIITNSDIYVLTHHPSPAASCTSFHTLFILYAYVSMIPLHYIEDK